MTEDSKRETPGGSETSRRHADRYAVARRYFLAQCPLALGSLAYVALARPMQIAAAGSEPVGPHFPGRAKRVIYLFMAGGPSQLELFSDKPMLRKHEGKPPPESFTKGRRFAFLKPEATLLGSRRTFARYGRCGMELSDLLPHHREIVDEVCWLRGVTTDVFNHGPAKQFMNTGFQLAGRPSLGSWAVYGLGSESENLPGFVVLLSGPRGPRSGNTLWSSGFFADHSSGSAAAVARQSDPALEAAR